jgi:hypothetical protein
MSDTTIITLRLPKSFVERADALIAQLAQDEEALLLGRVSRSIVLRLAVLRGLEALEAQVANRAEARGTTTKKVARGRAR